MVDDWLKRISIAALGSEAEQGVIESFVSSEGQGRRSNDSEVDEDTFGSIVHKRLESRSKRNHQGVR